MSVRKLELQDPQNARKVSAGPSSTGSVSAIGNPEGQASQIIIPKRGKNVGVANPALNTQFTIDGKVYVVSDIPNNKEALCCSYSEEYNYIGVGYTDGVVKGYSTNNGQLAFTLTDPDVKDNRAPVTSIKHKPVSKSYPITNCFTATYANGCVKCWNFIFNQCVYTIREKRQTFGIVYHPRYPKFVTFGDNMKIYFYDEESKTQERVLSSSDKKDVHDGHMSRIFAACFHPKNNYELLTGGWDNVVCFWDLRQPYAVRHLSGLHICGEGIDINQKGTEVLCCSFQKENPIQIFDYGSGKLINAIEPDVHLAKLYCGRYATRDFIVTAGTDPNIFRVIDLKTLSTSASITQLPGAIYSMDVGVYRQRKIDKASVKSDIAFVPRMAFVSAKNLYQVDFY